MKILKKLATCLFLVTAVIAGVLPATPVRSQEQSSVLSNINLFLDLTGKEPLLTINLELQNQSSDKVITKYEIPNIWGLKSANIASVVPQGKLSGHGLDSAKLLLKFDTNPIKPGEKANIQVKASASNLYKNGEFRSWRQDNFNLFLDNHRLQLKSYELSYPSSWPQPAVDLLPEYYSIQTDQQKSRLLLSKPELGFTAIWAGAAKLTADYEYFIEPLEGGENAVLVPLPRSGTTQTAQLIDYTGVGDIYRDDDGNNFISVQANGQTRFEHTLLVELDPAKAAKPKPTSAVVYSQLPIPQKLQKKLDQGELWKSADLTAALNNTIELISSNYKIATFSPAQFSVSDAGLAGQADLNYAEYLSLLNALLHEQGVASELVLVDRSLLGTGPEFLLEICDKACNYYDSRPSAGPFRSRKTAIAGVQLLAFSGLNQLVFEQIRNLDKITPGKLSFANSQVQGLNSKDERVDLRLSIPAEVLNFSNFKANISIENHTASPVFLSELVIENNTFPIIDNTLAGLHEGVLPGERKEFDVENVFVPRFFLGDRNRVVVNLNLIYQTNQGYADFPVQQSVLLRQNYLFLGVIALALFACIVALVTTVTLARRNKYVILGGYWQLRRKLSEFKWNLRQSVNRRSKMT
jgi:hypothetical protein